jgi:two-component system, cell cycle response regulator
MTTILIAEDSALVRAVLRQQLEEQGYDIAEADDGFSAVALCEAVRPDAVLLDIEMPGLDGLQVLELLQDRPGLRDIPVVFLTGRTSTDDIVTGLRLGAHDYLKKPFENLELTARVGVAVRVKQLQDELRRRNDELDQLARIDALTAVYNRRHMEEELQRLATASRRDGRPLGLLLLDLDHFKAVNDTYGHGGGDTVLQQAAQRLGDATRAAGIVGRWGGEEFVVLLPGADLTETHAAAERARHLIAATPMRLDQLDVAVTASIGCAAATDGNVDTLLSRADVAMYRAKEGGRNRVVVAD